MFLKLIAPRRPHTQEHWGTHWVCVTRVCDFNNNKKNSHLCCVSLEEHNDGDGNEYCICFLGKTYIFYSVFMCVCQVSLVDTDQPLFQPFPSELVFQNFTPAQTYKLPLLLLNNDKVCEWGMNKSIVTLTTWLLSWCFRQEQLWTETVQLSGRFDQSSREKESLQHVCVRVFVCVMRCRLCVRKAEWLKGSCGIGGDLWDLRHHQVIMNKSSLVCVPGPVFVAVWGLQFFKVCLIFFCQGVTTSEAGAAGLRVFPCGQSRGCR